MILCHIVKKKNILQANHSEKKNPAHLGPTKKISCTKKLPNPPLKNLMVHPLSNKKYDENLSKAGFSLSKYTRTNSNEKVKNLQITLTFDTRHTTSHCARGASKIDTPKSASIYR